MQAADVPDPRVIELVEWPGAGPQALAEAEVVIATCAMLVHNRNARLNEILQFRDANQQPLFDALIFDEAHHMPANTWRTILHALGGVPVGRLAPNGAPFIGKPFVLFGTGTPHRLESANFNTDETIRRFTLADGMARRLTKHLIHLDITPGAGVGNHPLGWNEMIEVSQGWVIPPSWPSL